MIKRKPWGGGKVMIIGDRPGPSAPLEPDYHHTPFYSMKHCSGWLNRLLFNSGVDERDLIWLNAYDKDGEPHDHEIVERLLPPLDDFIIPIITLGSNAAKWLRSDGYEGFTEVKHPQYWKRFKSQERYELVDRINEFTNDCTV